MTQIAIGWQCAFCQLSRIGREDKGESLAWRCDPFPEGLPDVYDRGKEDCPYREAQSQDPWKPTSIPGTVESDVVEDEG